MCVSVWRFRQEKRMGDCVVRRNWVRVLINTHNYIISMKIFDNSWYSCLLTYWDFLYSISKHDYVGIYQKMLWTKNILISPTEIMDKIDKTCICVSISTLDFFYSILCYNWPMPDVVISQICRFRGMSKVLRL